MSNLWSLELELKALKTILTPKSEWGARLFSSVKADFFHHKVSKAIYARLKTLFDAGQMDLPSHDFLLQDPSIPENIRETASEAFRETPTVDNSGDFDYLVTALGKLAKARALYTSTADAANQISEPGHDQEIDLQEIADKLGETILSVDDDQEGSSHIQMGRGYNQEAEDAFQRVLYGEFTRSMIKTGFQEFDEKTGGHNRSNLVVIGANSGGGKSLYAVNLLVRQYRLGYNTILVSYEMCEEEVLVRLMSCIAEVPMNNIINSKLSPEEKQRIEIAWREFNLVGAEKGNSYCIICPRGETTVAEIGFRVRSLRPDSLILDYINLLDSPKYNADNQWQVLGQIAKESKLLANKLGCVVYLLAQIDETYNLRYSKGIKDHANFVMGWIRDETSMAEGIIEVHQMKARNAPLYSFTLTERFDIAQFRDPGQEDRASWPDESEYWAMLDRLKELGCMHGRSDVTEEDIEAQKPKTRRAKSQEPEPVNTDEEDTPPDAQEQKMDLRDEEISNGGELKLEDEAPPKKKKKKKRLRTELLWTAKDIVPADLGQVTEGERKLKKLRNNIRTYEDTI